MPLQSNWLLFLRVIQENNSGCFFSKCSNQHETYQTDHLLFNDREVHKMHSNQLYTTDKDILQVYHTYTSQ